MPDTQSNFHEPLPADVSNGSLYPLDQDQFHIEITANGKTLTHTLKRPTLQQLSDREQQSVYETEEISSGQDVVRVDDEKANAALWDKIAVSVTGYRTASYSPQDMIEITPDIAAKIPASHKATAIRGIYTINCEVEATEGDGFNLDGELFTVRQDIGTGETPDYVIRHTLRQPTEGERQEYKRKASQTIMTRGSKRIKARVQTNLRAGVELYDRLFVSIEGTTSDDKTLVDPVWKRQVIASLMTSFESALSD